MSKRVLVTGATGFIGTRLVGDLIDRGYKVRALVRSTSNSNDIQKLGCELYTADLLSGADAVAHAVADCDLVFHLAAQTRSVVSTDLVERNAKCMQNLVDGILKDASPTRLVYVSSLAAAGPSTETQPLQESQPRKPTSWYGRSKAACEEIAEAHADQISTSIVRPPIVLGETDRHGWLMFDPIDKLGLHFVPGFKTRYFSAIYVGDLCEALITVAEKGQSLPSQHDASVGEAGQGIYYATSPEVFSFAELGHAIGKAIGRRNVWAIPVAMPILFLTAMFNELKGRLLQTPQFLNRDKYGEAVVGSWFCSGEKLKTELGFSPRFSMEERLKTIVAGYRARGWLRPAAGEPTISPGLDRKKAGSREQSFG